MSLRETIDWLIATERLAIDFYDNVVENFITDKEWSAFFRHMLIEERLHEEVMVKASKYIAEHMSPPPAISVDEETREKIAAPFVRSSELLSTGNFSKEDIIDCLVRAEFSEWNDIFLYVLKSLREEKEFMPVLARMDRHLNEIEKFVESLPEGRKYLHIIKSLPRVWTKHILIIDDELPILEFLGKLFVHEGHVETARNGKEGLQKLKGGYFDVIISDIDMPVMSGIEFYTEASAMDPEVGKRLLFVSGLLKSEHSEFIRRNNLRYMSKPAPIKEIVKSVSELLHKTDTD